MSPGAILGTRFPAAVAREAEGAKGGEEQNFRVPRLPRRRRRWLTVGEESPVVGMLDATHTVAASMLHGSHPAMVKAWASCGALQLPNDQRQLQLAKMMTLHRLDSQVCRFACFAVPNPLAFHGRSIGKDPTVNRSLARLFAVQLRQQCSAVCKHRFYSDNRGAADQPHAPHPVSRFRGKRKT